MLSSYWTPEIRQARDREYRFICLARKRCRIVADNLVINPDGPSPSKLAREIFADGVNRHIISGTFDEFFGFCLDCYGFNMWYGSTPYYPVLKGYIGDPFCRHGKYYRQGPHYRRRAHHQSKEPSHKAAWRVHKQMDRDKARSPYRRHEKAGRWNKQMVSRQNRRWVKQRIVAGDFDKITQNVKDIIRKWWD